MRRVLIVADAACESGFAKCTQKMLLPELCKTWDSMIVGMNYRGDGHDWTFEREGQTFAHDIKPAFVAGGDLFGVRRLADFATRYQPQLIILQNDPWNIPAYMQSLEQIDCEIPVMAAVAVDGKNCMGLALNKLARAVFWTEFGQREAVAGGMTTPSGVVPLGVDLDVYRPGDRATARNRIGLPEDVKAGFIVGNINRNQVRKRLDLTVRYFGRWIKEFKIDDAFLYVHTCPTGDMGHDVERLARYYGFNSTTETSRLILAEPEPYKGTSEQWVVCTMQSFDVGINTGLGEGWGLPAIEMMACGIPQILPQWSAYEEWAAPAALMVPCTSTQANAKSVIGGVADEEQFILALDRMYRDSKLREEHRRRGFKLVQDPRYRWQNIATRFAEEVELACQPVLV